MVCAKNDTENAVSAHITTGVYYCYVSLHRINRLTMKKEKIIVVGASSGIGRALAETLASAGHTVGITGRRRERLTQIAATQPERFHVRSFDVTDTTACTAELDALAAAMGGVDTVVISAGGGDVNEQLD